MSLQIQAKMISNSSHFWSWIRGEAVLGVPEKYKVGKQLDIKTFMTIDLIPNEKKRFRDAVHKITLDYQIAGEEIPSLIDSHYDCQVIMLITVKLKSVKIASFIGDVIQRLIKSFCVVKCVDLKGMEVYVFAHKRLNLQDPTKVVIVEDVVTSPMSDQFSDEVSEKMHEFTYFKCIKNKTTKLSLYLELMTKSYITSNLSLWSGGENLLSSKAWYNTEDVINILTIYKKLNQVKKDQKSANTVSGNAQYNAQLKAIYSELTIIINRK